MNPLTLLSGCYKEAWLYLVVTGLQGSRHSCCGKISHFLFPDSVFRTEGLAFSGDRGELALFVLDSGRGKVVTNFLPRVLPHCDSDVI